ncbi:amino acid permease/ SLC12A domain-containing protein [Usnea florida]
MVDTTNGQFHSSFTPHQVHIISLGSNIGSGLFIGTGAALASGGPGNMVIAYLMVCTCVWAVLQSLSEMTIAFPTSGNYIDYADRWVDPALAFGAGFAEWLGWTSIVASEAAFFNILIQFWANGDFPKAASLTIFVVTTCVIFSMPNKIFAWFEYFTSLIKIVLFMLIILLSLAIVCGAGPKGYVHHGSTWTDYPPFKNGFSGFAHAALLATWAVGDQIFIGIMGGEAQNPRFSMGHATKLVPYRVIFVYMTCVIFITLLIPSNNDQLLGGSGVTASPFVLAIELANIPYVSSVLNAGIMCGILAISAESIYLSSRILRTMSNQKLIPEWVAHVDRKGRPVRSLIVTCLTAVVLSYINLSAGGTTALSWFVSITSASFFVNWMVVSFTSWRFHKALAAQQDTLFTNLYAWRSSMWPLAPVWLMTISTLLLICCIYGETSTTASNFFQYTIGIILIFALTVGYKLIYRTPWRDPKTADCLTGRRKLTPEDIAQLDKYYAQPGWRRFLTYVKLW